MERKKQLSKKFFKIWSKFYDCLPIISWYFIFALKLLVNELKNFKAFQSFKSRLLDLGCGTALLSNYLPDAITYYGMDFSQAMLAKAKLKPKAKFLIKGDIENFSLKTLKTKEKFDIATSTFVFHHVPRIEKVIRNISKVLKKEGIFALIDIRCFPFGIISKLIEPGFVKYWSTDEIVSMANKFGFKKVFLKKYFSFFLLIFKYKSF